MASKITCTCMSGVILLFVTTVVRSDMCPYIEAYYNEYEKKTTYSKNEVWCEGDCCGDGIYINCCYYGEDDTVSKSGVLIGVLFGAAVMFGLCLMCAKFFCQPKLSTDLPRSQTTQQTPGGQTNVVFTTEVQQNPYSLPPPSYEECASDSVYFQKNADKATPGSVKEDQQLPDYHSYIKVLHPSLGATNNITSESQSSLPDNSTEDQSQIECTSL